MILADCSRSCTPSDPAIHPSSIASRSHSLVGCPAAITSPPLSLPMRLKEATSMSSRDRLYLLTWMLVATLALATFVPSMIPDASAQGARNLTVLVGGGQDTVQALAFFPQ